MTGPDLSPAVEALLDLMEDACTVTYDAEGDEDDTLDQDTGEIVHPVPDSKRVYTGKCMFSPRGSGGDQARGGGVAAAQQYTLSLPLTAPELPRGAVVTCTASRRDKTLPKTRFQVLYPLHSTFTVSRKCVVEVRGTAQ